MTVNHDVAGSSPAGGAKTKATHSGGFSFWPSSSRLDTEASTITGIAELARLMTAMFIAFAKQNAHQSGQDKLVAVGSRSESTAVS